MKSHFSSAAFWLDVHAVLFSLIRSRRQHRTRRDQFLSPRIEHRCESLSLDLRLSQLRAAAPISSHDGEGGLLCLSSELTLDGIKARCARIKGLTFAAVASNQSALKRHRTFETET
jgi:hypothetical protein